MCGYGCLNIGIGGATPGIGAKRLRRAGAKNRKRTERALSWLKVTIAALGFVVIMTVCAIWQ